MAIIEENLNHFETALAQLESATKDARRISRKVRNNLDFAADLTQTQIDTRLAKITPSAAALQAAVTAAQDVLAATEPIVEAK